MKGQMTHRQTTVQDRSVTSDSARGRLHSEQMTMPKAVRFPFPVPTSRIAPALVSASEFEKLTQDAIRQMRRSASISRVEERVLDDLARGRGVTMVRKALEIGRERSSDRADATALPELWRGYVLSGHPAECSVAHATDRETKANGDFDLAQYAYERDPSQANYDRLVETGNRQIIETRMVLDAAHARRARG